MKVGLFLHSLAMGGSERVAATLANHWASVGWKVSVITLADRANDHYLLDPSVRHVALDVASNSSGILHGILSNATRVAALNRAISQLDADVVVALTSTCNVLLSLATGRHERVIRVGSERAHPPKMPLKSPWRLLRRVTYGRLDAVVAQTEVTAAWLRSNTSAREVRIIPNPMMWPIPVTSPVRAPSSVGAEGRKRVLSVGRLSIEKGFDRLIDAFAEVAENHPDWELVIVGDGPERAALHRQVRDRGATKRILLPGAVGNIGEWYAAADLYVLTSHFEGFPNALVEAMAHGLPAIAVDCDAGPREIVRDGVDGLLIEPNSQYALRGAMAELMRDAVHRARLAARACEARQRFSMEHVHELWRQLFLDLTYR